MFAIPTYELTLFTWSRELTIHFSQGIMMQVTIVFANSLFGSISVQTRTCTYHQHIIIMSESLMDLKLVIHGQTRANK
jgi:hypothetical protein